MNKRRTAGFIAATAVLLILFYFADISEFITVVKSISLRFLIICMTLGISVIILWSIIWYMFLGELNKNLTYISTFRLFSAGVFLNLVTPLGQFGGEPFIAYILSKDANIKYEEAFSLVLSADIVNALPQYTFFSGAIIYLTLLGFETFKSGYLNIGAIVIALVVITSTYIILFKFENIEYMLIKTVKKGSIQFRTIEKYKAAIQGKIENLRSTFDLIGDNKLKIGQSIVISHLAMLVQILMLYIIIKALSISIDPVYLFYIIPLAGLANFSPTPGGSGAYEGVLSLLLAYFSSADFSIAFTAAIIFRIFTYWQWLSIGYIALISMKH